MGGLVDGAFPMPANQPPRIAYVLKRYPRLSETFIVNELLGLNGLGAELSITSLLPREPEAIEHAAVRDVRADVCYVSDLGRVRRLAAHTRVARSRPAAYVRAASDAVRESISARDRRAWKDFRRAVIVADRVERRGAQHIHAHFATAATRTAIVAADLTGRSISFTAHAKDIYVIDEDGRRRLRGYLDRASFVVTVSEFNRRYLAELAPASAHKLRLVPNGLAPEWFDEPLRTNTADVPLVLAVGRLVEKKGFADLIDAAKLLRERGVRFQCRLVGSGPLADDLRRQVDECGLEDEFDFAGPSEQTTLRDIHYATAACLVVPCVVAETGDRDGLPTVVIEAMASGVPVIATDVTALPEIVVDGVTGLLVPQRDPVALAEAVERLLGDRQLAEQLASNARHAVGEQFDRRATAASLWHLIDEAIAVPSDRAAEIRPAFQEVTS